VPCSLSAASAVIETDSRNAATSFLGSNMVLTIYAQALLYSSEYP
jgi:hypothetical protein